MQQQQPGIVTHSRISSLLISRHLTRPTVASRYSVRTSSVTESGRGNPKICGCASRASGWTPLSEFLNPPLWDHYYVTDWKWWTLLVCSVDLVRMCPQFPVHGCEIKSGSGLGTRLKGSPNPSPFHLTTLYSSFSLPPPAKHTLVSFEIIPKPKVESWLKGHPHL